MKQDSFQEPKVTQLVKKFTTLEAIVDFIPPLEFIWKTRNLSTSSHSTSLTYISVLFSHVFLVLPSGVFPSSSPIKTL